MYCSAVQSVHACSENIKILGSLSYLDSVVLYKGRSDKNITLDNLGLNNGVIDFLKRCICLLSLSVQKDGDMCLQDAGGRS